MQKESLEMVEPDELGAGREISGQKGITKTSAII